ncbi:hypothetical protein GCM10011579_051360 [Streptomyces albiflavescens]|uniref:Uncharacterized protein n=1 Tax=Streptomyces albiflavescens TaxID=1623582 RepID=A0A917Y6E6_9ACTN|nr:protein phosphatase 2C domain-containing protein [Streptomyces albiflavescens]GGN73319.1 hypothetical protein GCM10011579_051360 [Streptomyces albiflavescens]
MTTHHGPAGAPAPAGAPHRAAGSGPGTPERPDPPHGGAPPDPSHAPPPGLPPGATGAPTSAHSVLNPSPHRPPPPQMIWRHGQQGLQAVSVWTERVPGRGEDAEPFIAHHLSTGQGLIAVFDGSGGAGSSPVWQAPDGETRTGAWVGSRVARLATDCWFHDVVGEDEADTPDHLHAYLEHFLASAPQRRSKIVGKMRRQLPTTLAAVQYRMYEDNVLECQALWAGDSRAYVLLPQSGLHVLTRDHTEESDALALLRSDPPMTNSVSADREFYVDAERVTLELPCVLLAATDGFFGYVHTPAEFEYVLLKTLMRANDEFEWADLIRRRVQDYTADDASLALVALGYGDFAQLRAAFSGRRAVVEELCLDGRPQGADQASAMRPWQEATWGAYRAGYETHLPPLSEERP